VRASNCLKTAKHPHHRHLVQKTEAELLKTKNFGKSPSTRSRPSWARWPLARHEARPEELERLRSQYERAYET